MAHSSRTQDSKRQEHGGGAAGLSWLSVVGLLGLAAMVGLLAQKRALARLPDAAATAYTQADFRKLLPLHFEANYGQAEPRVKFLARLPGYTVFLTPSEAVLVLP